MNYKKAIAICILTVLFDKSFAQAPDSVDKILKFAWRLDRSQFIDYFLGQGYNPIRISETSSCLIKQGNALYSAHFYEAEAAYKCSKEVFIAYKNYVKQRYKLTLRGRMVDASELPLRYQQYYCKCQQPGEVYDESDYKLQYSFQILTPKDSEDQVQYWIIYREGGPHFRLKTDNPLNN